MKTVITLLILLLGLCALGWTYLESDPARPTPSGAIDVPAYIGVPASANPVTEASNRFQHPFLAPAGL